MHPRSLAATALALATCACASSPKPAPPPIAAQPVHAAPKAAAEPSAAAAAPPAAPIDPTSQPTAIGSNLLRNPGFELGRDGWTSMGTQAWGAFEVVTSPVRSGAHSARLLVSATPATREPAKVFGVVQEIRRDQLPAGFPDTMSGWYRVSDWQKPTKAAVMYVQAVVIVWGDPRTPKLVGQAPSDKPIANYQIRFYLAGLTEPAFMLGNAKLEFVTKGDPRMNEWVRFDIPVKAKFLERWGVVPADYEFIRVLFEARWDRRQPDEVMNGDVVYDDLFFGYGDAPK